MECVCLVCNAKKVLWDLWAKIPHYEDVFDLIVVYLKKNTFIDRKGYCHCSVFKSMGPKTLM